MNFLGAFHGTQRHRMIKCNAKCTNKQKNNKTKTIAI